MQKGGSMRTENKDGSTKLDTSLTPLRRAPMPEAQAWAFAAAAPYCVLSTVDEAGNPYGVPVSAVVDPAERSAYFHTTAFADSRKTRNMLANPKVSLLFVGEASTCGERYTVDYRSVVMAGRAERLAGAACAAAMERLLKRFAPMQSDEANRAYIARQSVMPALWRVSIDSITGKDHRGF